MEKVSKGFYLGSWLGGVIAMFVCLIAGVVMIAGDEELAPLAGILISVGYAAAIYGMVVLFILVYKMWKAIQGPDARTTPGKAVGFLFIPLFNLYWIFQAYHGWAQDYNKNAKSLQLSVPEMPEGLGMAMCVCLLLGMVPGLNLIMPLVNIIMFAIFFNKAIDGVNALVDAIGQAPVLDELVAAAPPTEVEL